MSTTNIVFKIDEVAKEFGFTLKEKQKNYKKACLFFVKLLWLHFKFLAHLQLWSIDRNIHSSCFLY